MQPHYSQSSRENATPSSGTSPVASYREVPPTPGFYSIWVKTIVGCFEVVVFVVEDRSFLCKLFQVRSAEEGLKKVLNERKKLEWKLSESQKEKKNLDKEHARVMYAICIWNILKSAWACSWKLHHVTVNYLTNGKRHNVHYWVMDARGRLLRKKKKRKSRTRR